MEAIAELRNIGVQHALNVSVFIDVDVYLQN